MMTTTTVSINHAQHTFGDLSDGDKFIFKDSPRCLHMKISTVNASGVICNAVNLITGEFNFLCDELVVPLNLEIKCKEV